MLNFLSKLKLNLLYFYYTKFKSKDLRKQLYRQIMSIKIKKQLKDLK